MESVGCGMARKLHPASLSDLELKPPHALLTERWDTQYNTFDSRTYKDAKRNYEIRLDAKVGEASELTLKQDTGRESSVIATALLETVPGAVRVLDLFARHPDLLNQPRSGADESERREVFNEYISSDHAMYHGRWRDGSHSDLAVATCEDAFREYEVAWALYDEESLLRANLLILTPEEDGERSIGQVCVQNTKAMVHVVDALMARSTEFDPRDRRDIHRTK